MKTIAAPRLDLFARMFPGDPKRGIPDFAEAGAFTALASTCADLPALDRLLSESVEDLQAQDINDVLTGLRAKAQDLMQSVVEQATVAYLSCPRVATALTGAPSPLFPTNRVMGEIDFDLLEPVLTHCRDPHGD